MTENYSRVFRDLDAQTRRAAEGGFAARTLPQPEVSGASEQDEVRVSLTGGRVTDVEIDVRAMRLSNAELGEKVADAMNAALQAHATAIADAMADQRTDFGKLREELTQMGQEAQRAMERYTAGMNDSLAQARSAAQFAASVRTRGEDLE